MAAVVLLFLISLLDSVEGVENRFVKSGSNLLLEAKTTDLGENEEFIWKFNNTINLVKFRHGVDPFIKYVQRTVFSTQNYSLLLRNMQHSDTGNYKEIISGLEDKIVAEYTVIVQDPVSPVNLIVTPSDPSYCNFTATCRIKDSQISGSFQCENKTCRLVDQTHLKVSSLNVYVKESSIICNHSNQVSWEKDVKNVSSFCENLPVYNRTIVINVVRITLAAILVVICTLTAVVRKCKRKRKPEQTSHEFQE
ncbi:SLAM family member 6-like [Xiphophorus maculatus]|uniref:SLAM family member 6-like n=1 Tax=Xiphophorus maculatus TaxID=8083 RepID=UPI000C6DB201|nr:SLAM family member 6-like [Xiphophorus maculatus]